jgi:hypothetical protein
VGGVESYARYLRSPLRTRTPSSTEKILDAVFTVTGPETMEKKKLGLCSIWRDVLLYATKGDIERRTTALQEEWEDRL